MPHHPFHICFSHIINDGLNNIDFLSKQTGSSKLIQLELNHLKEVASIQKGILFHMSSSPRTYKRETFDVYWNKIKPTYEKEATEQMKINHDTGWHFLGVYYREEVDY